MPGGDGTGPDGRGGFCTPLWASGQIPSPLGFGRGTGRGRGYRWIYRATGLPLWARSGVGIGVSTPIPQQQAPVQPSQNLQRDQEILLLKNQATTLEQELKEIRDRIKELEKEK